MEAHGLLRFRVLETSPDRYVSFLPALNLHLDGEDTGDWHFLATWFTDTPDDRRGPIGTAGRGSRVDTTPALGTQGVRDMRNVLYERELADTRDRPVWVADHFRAVADIVFIDSREGRTRRHATHRQINAWLHTEDEIEALKADYLTPLSAILPEDRKEAHVAFAEALTWD